MVSRKENEFQYNFLNDRPTNKDDIGTHETIAESLLSIIHSNLKKPFVIGLFGDWGVGKSSIVEMLQEKVRTSKETIKVVVVDAWRKHRETFLREFVKKLARELLNKEQAEKIAEETDVRKVKHTSSWMPGPLAKACFWIFVALVVVLGCILVKFWLANPDSKFPASEIAVMILTVLLAVYFQYVLPNYSIQTGDDIEDVTLRDVTHFRKIYFEQIIDKCKPKTVYIVIDNLDRVDAEDAVAIMRAIKTFMVDVEEKGPTEESKDAVPHKMLNKVVFIIPCDDGALRKHIIKRNSERNGNEFLRKFFSICLRIPKFNERDCYQYACNLLGETNLKLNEVPKDKIADIIKSLFGNNPRQPKIFINNFLARYIVAETFEKDRKLPEEIATGHPEWLAVYVALDTEFSDLKMPKTAEEFRALLKGDDQDENGYEKARIDSRVAFLQKVRFTVEKITPKAWAAYHYLKKANDVLLIEGFEELEEAALKGTDDFIDKLENVRAKHPNVVQLLWNVSSGEEARIKIMQSILRARAKILKLPLEGRIPEEMASLIRDRIDDLPMLAVDVVYQEILRPYEWILHGILYDIETTDAEGLKPDLYKDGGPKEFQVELLREILANDERLSARTRNRLGKAVHLLGGRSNKLTIPAIRNGKYPSPTIIDQGIGLFREGSEDLYPPDLITFCRSFKDDKCINYLKQIVDVLNQNLGGHKYKTDELCETASRVKALIDRKHKKGINVAQVNAMNTISALDRRYNEDNDWEARYKILKTLEEYSELAAAEFYQFRDNVKRILIKLGNSFLKSGEDNVVSKFLKNEQKMVKANFASVLPATALRSEKLCHVVLDCYSEAFQTVIGSVFPSKPEWIITWVKPKGSNLEEKTKEDFQSSLLAVASQKAYRIEVYEALSFLDVSKSESAQRNRENHFSILIKAQVPLEIEENLIFALARIVKAKYIVNEDQANKLEDAFKKVKQDIISSELIDLIKNYKKLKKSK